MKNCPKCNSENIKKYPHSAQRKNEGEKCQEQGNQMVSYQCRSCNNGWQIKFSEDNN